MDASAPDVVNIVTPATVTTTPTWSGYAWSFKGYDRKTKADISVQVPANASFASTRYPDLNWKDLTLSEAQKAIGEDVALVYAAGSYVTPFHATHTLLASPGLIKIYYGIGADFQGSLPG